jgi:hypothetical protein
VLNKAIQPITNELNDEKISFVANIESLLVAMQLLNNPNNGNQLKQADMFRLELL